MNEQQSQTNVFPWIQVSARNCSTAGQKVYVRIHKRIITRKKASLKAA